MPKPKRHVHQTAAETTTPPPALQPNQSLARVIKAEGSSLFLCELPGGSSSSSQPRREVLLELAPRFRNAFWIRRGGFVLAEQRSAEEGGGGRVVGDIVNVVREERLWRKQAYWPKEFEKPKEEDSDEESTAGKLPPTDSESEGEE